MIYPISFSIPSIKIVNEIPTKTQILSSLIPGDGRTYIYKTEEDYYNNYKKSLFAITKCKSGWDCMRHYEILACGTIPYFIDLDKCPNNTMTNFPKKLILETNRLFEHIYNNYNSINSIPTDLLNICYNYINLLLDYTRNNLSCIECAKYILNATNNNNCKKVLFLSDNTSPDYLREMVLIGFKELFKKDCYDYLKIPYLYKSYNLPISDLYGRGMTYTKNLNDDDYNELNKNLVIDAIKNKEFDLIIYGHYTRSLLFYDIVKNYYEPSKIIMINGEDIDYNHTKHIELNNQGFNVFFRELL